MPITARLSVLSPMRLAVLVLAASAGLCASAHALAQGTPAVSPATPAAAPAAQQVDLGMRRIDWWREARFGMFIHWGLYAIPAGEWPGSAGKGHGEWIRDTAKIPLEDYDKLKDRFNPEHFDAAAWAAAAKSAGMEYMVLTTKHHDGFALFDSKHTEWDVMSTPFKRDIMREFVDAARAAGITPGFYYSIMDWHHPDYLPRRPWDKRSADGADFEKYNTYLKNQITELLTNYGPIGVLWFDGQWEGTWTHERGLDLYTHARKLQPNVLINNRVDKGGGAYQITRSDPDTQFAGDFSTPEQEVPPRALRDIDWETCMTMNDHWGFNAADVNFKSSTQLIRTLVDVASKGGNFLLNVGPDAQGRIPQQSLDRLKDIGSWMRVNGDAIHGTQAGPAFPDLPWGRVTMREVEGPDGKALTRLFFHVFEWPADGKLVIPELYSTPMSAYLLADTNSNLKFTRQDTPEGGALVIEVPSKAPDASVSVVAADFIGMLDIGLMPEIRSSSDIFTAGQPVHVLTPRFGVALRYTLDGTDPTPQSPRSTAGLILNETTTVTARAFKGEQPVSPIARRTFTKVTPNAGTFTAAKTPGVSYQYFEGDFDKVPDFTTLTPKASGIADAFDRSQRQRDEGFAFRYTGFLRVPADGVYTFTLASDDGSALRVGKQLVVDNDGLHSLQTRTGAVALASGIHEVTVEFFEKSGGHELQVWMTAPGAAMKKLDPKTMLLTTDAE